MNAGNRTSITTNGLRAAQSGVLLLFICLPLLMLVPGCSERPSTETTAERQEKIRKISTDPNIPPAIRQRLLSDMKADAQKPKGTL